AVLADVERGPGPMLPDGSPFEDFFRDLFENGPRGLPRERRTASVGAGFIISADGYIVTNNHVIQAADQVQVEPFSGGALGARAVRGALPSVVARLAADRCERLALGSGGASDRARGGAWVLAICNRRGPGFSVSPGSVSPLSRSRPGSYGGFIQTEAPNNWAN